MGIIVRIAAIATGIFLLCQVIHAMKTRKMSESQSVFWLLGAVMIIVLAAVPNILPWLATLLEIWWPPAALLFFIVVILSFIAFNHTEEISDLRSQITELSMQVVLLQDENSRLKKENEEKQD